MNSKKDNLNDVALGTIIEIFNNILKLKKNKNNELESYLNEVDKSLINKDFSEEYINFIWTQVKELLEKNNKQYYDTSQSETIELIQIHIGKKKNRNK